MVPSHQHGVLTNFVCLLLFLNSFLSFLSATGHVFNMPHDNVKACEEVFGKLQDNHMMSPTLIRINRTSPWSPCSAAIITDYLDSGHGKSKKAILVISCRPKRPLSPV